MSYINVTYLKLKLKTGRIQFHHQKRRLLLKKKNGFYLFNFSHKNGSIKSTKSQKFWDFEIFFCFSLITNMPNDDNFHLEYNLAALVAHQVTFNRLLRGSQIWGPLGTQVLKKSLVSEGLKMLLKIVILLEKFVKIGSEVRIPHFPS